MHIAISRVNTERIIEEYIAIEGDRSEKLKIRNTN